MLRLVFLASIARFTIENLKYEINANKVLVQGDFYINEELQEKR